MRYISAYIRGLFFLCIFALFFPASTYAQNLSEPITLSNILQRVYRNNPTLKAAREKLGETQELYPQAKAGWLPTLNAETSIYSSDVESSNFANADGATTKDMTLSLNQPVFSGGRTVAQSARASNLIYAEESALRNTEQDIFLEALTAWADVLRDRKILELRKSNEDILQKELSAVQERYDIGETTITDVHQAATRYNRARSGTTDAFGNLDASEAEFMGVTGIAPPDRLPEYEIDFDFPDHVEKMVLLAEKRSPELKIVKYEQRAAENNADAAFGELLPQVSAFASYNKQYDPQPGLVDESETQTVGLKATIALYEGGATRSRIREARKAAMRRDYEIDATRQRLRQDVTRNWRLYLARRAETEIRLAEIKAADLALTGVREEARLGQRTVLDVLDADQDVIDARIALARAERNETVTRYSLASSLGLLHPRVLKLIEANATK